MSAPTFRLVETVGELYDIMLRTAPVPEERLPRLLTPSEWPGLKELSATSVFNPVWLRYRTRGNAGGKGVDTQRLAVFRVGFKADSPVYIMNTGCDHKFEQFTLGNCYNEYRCSVEGCGFAYRVDSSD